ncbi:hypothetical protein PIB30_070026 [Stylosanthes scabra]|uniref:TIR domain-containing protein n=1 Tax=Stylosanthes scabra TaxID=79078 RepID=A0ABU6XLK7_9FABA|nr:hypothetical protein [Stylosanthes scabra]
MTLPSSSSSSSPTATHKYDVFISFRGEDTRVTASSTKPDRDVVWNELVEAIRDSKLFLVIFSQDYASSKWCLRELVEIMECKNKKEHVIVIPVFYKIEPTHVRNQTGSYSRAFAKHERSCDRKQVQQWRTALTEAANLSGFH